MPLITIRSAQQEDLPAIIAIEQQCFPPAEAATAETFLQRWNTFRENFFVAVNQAGQVIGFINGCTYDQPELPDQLYHDCTLHNPHGAYQTIFGLDVLPAYRRQGIAARLMTQMIEHSRQQGRTGIVLTCKDHMVAYYQRLGYQLQGRSASTHGGASWNDMVLLFADQTNSTMM